MTLRLSFTADWINRFLNVNKLRKPYHAIPLEGEQIFVPSVDGVSHREDEFTEWDGIVVGTEVLLEAVQRRAEE